MEGINIRQDKQLFPEKPTCGNIKAYVKEKYGFEVTNLYIAQMKDRMGLEKRANYNIGAGKAIVPNCPPEKAEAIVDAFRHFGIL